MDWTALNYQKPRTQVWREGYERKIIFGTWDTQIYSQKAGKSRSQVNPEDHETYRSGVGTLLYLTKHSRPDISNPVKEYQEDGKIIIKFVKSEENEADIFTKNTTNVIFGNHQKKLVWDKANVENDMNQELDQSKNQQEGC